MLWRPRTRAGPGASDRADAVEAIDEPLSPALGRLDHAFPNLLVDLESGTVEAALDWESVHVVAPAYDLAAVERVLPGASRQVLEGVPDRRETVGAALPEGYRREAPAPPGLDAMRACCRLEHLAIAMNSLDGGRLGATLPEEQIEAAAAGVRATVEAHLG